MPSAAIANTQQSYLMNGVAEDISDEIVMIEDMTMPLTKRLKSKKAGSKLYEWQTIALNSADTGNNTFEGFEAPPYEAPTQTRMLNNRLQISQKNGVVSGTSNAMNTIGRAKEKEYQRSLRMKELRRDQEAILFAPQAAAAEVPGTSGRTTGTLDAYIANVHGNPGASQAAFVDANMELVDTTGGTLPTPGTARSLTRDMIDEALETAYMEGAKPTELFLSPKNKRNFSKLFLTDTGLVDQQINAGRIDAIKARGSVTLYESDFGTLTSHVSTYIGDGNIKILDFDYLCMRHAPGRKMVSKSLAATGDNEKFLLISEWGLECKGPKAHISIRDLDGTYTAA